MFGQDQPFSGDASSSPSDCLAGPRAFWVSSVPLLDPLCPHRTVFGTTAFKAGRVSPSQNRVGCSSFAPLCKLKVSFSACTDGTSAQGCAEAAPSPGAHSGRPASSLRPASRSAERSRLCHSVLLRDFHARLAGGSVSIPHTVCWIHD